MADDNMVQDASIEADDGQEPAAETSADDGLMREIKKLRRENAKWRTQLRSLEEQEDERKKAEMSDLERLKAELEAAKQARIAAENERIAQSVRTQIISTAARLGFADPDDAHKMLGLDSLEVDDSGNVDGLEDTLKGLLKSKPYLAKQTTQAQYSATNPANPGNQESDAARLARIYGVSGKSSIFGGSGGGVVWTPNATE